MVNQTQKHVFFLLLFFSFPHHEDFQLNKFSFTEIIIINLFFTLHNILLASIWQSHVLFPMLHWRNGKVIMMWECDRTWQLHDTVHILHSRGFKSLARDACCNWLYRWRVELFTGFITGKPTCGRVKLDRTSRHYTVYIYVYIVWVCCSVFVRAKCVHVRTKKRQCYLLVWVTKCMCAEDVTKCMHVTVCVCMRRSGGSIH